MEILLVLQIVVVVALIGIILVQKSSSDGFTGGSSTNSFLTGRASANLFTRTTAILATIFILNSLTLAYMASHSERADSLIDKAAAEANAEKAANPDKKSGGLEDLRKKMEQTTDEKPAEQKPAEQNKPVEQAPATKEEQKPENQAPKGPSVPVSE